MTPDANDLCVFAVNRGSVENKEIYCNPLYPYYLALIEKYRKSPFANGVMNDYIMVNPKTDTSMLSDDSSVSFIPMSNVQEKNNTVTFDQVPYGLVKKGFTVFQRGDMLWAKITPCMQNGKSCITDKMPTDIGFGSTEFHVIRKRSNNVYMPFVWSIFANENVLLAAQATFSGTAGQQRVSASFLEEFPAVLPDYETQKKLVEELEIKLQARNQKLLKAERMIDAFETDLESRLDLSSECKNKLYYAIRLSQLDGVIDAKRYMSVKKENETALSEYCEIMDEKENVSIYGNQIVDWIRIDDLPNNPVEIETVRTVTASAMEGSFFKVQQGDILVARLGPTILNKKTVMVRSTVRTTVASAEFLVLRCKEEVDPEAVMAVLKTPYYQKLMYSHARGSTPSRYRLNRDDALQLPFPDIRPVQTEIAKEANRVRNEVKRLRTEAQEGWKAAKLQFEKELLGE